MIAHRLDSLLEFDTIAVLEEGSLAETGSPKELLLEGGGVFAQLYDSDKTNKRRKSDEISRA
jgi:ABC-type multidrug transport system fused ATPase/permease subunit